MQRESLLRQIIWDYDIPAEDIDAVLRGRKETAGHLTKGDIFRRILESYPWFTVLEIFTPEEIRILLDKDVIKKMRSPSLKKKYEFISRRLQEVILFPG